MLTVAATEVTLQCANNVISCCSSLFSSCDFLSSPISLTVTPILSRLPDPCFTARPYSRFNRERTLRLDLRTGVGQRGVRVGECCKLLPVVKALLPAMAACRAVASPQEGMETLQRPCASYLTYPLWGKVGTVGARLRCGVGPLVFSAFMRRRCVRQKVSRLGCRLFVGRPLHNAGGYQGGAPLSQECSRWQLK